MTKILATAFGAIVLLAGTPAAFASCSGDAAASRVECLRYGGSPGQCAAMYRDDLRECGRYVPILRRPMPRPTPRPMPPRPAPPPPPPRR